MLDHQCGSWVGYEPMRGRRFDSHLAEFIRRKRHSAGFRKPIDANLSAAIDVCAICSANRTAVSVRAAASETAATRSGRSRGAPCGRRLLAVSSEDSSRIAKPDTADHDKC